MAKNELKPLVEALQQRLEPLGYVKRARAGGASFQNKQSDDVHRYVNVQRFQWGDAFGVSLEEMRASGPSRVLLLEQLDGLGAYSFEEATLDVAIQRALTRFDDTFSRWEAGESFIDPEVQKESFDRMILEGRSAYKVGDFEEAVRLFGAAEKLAPLSGLDAKFVKVAKQRIVK